ncbi:MAG: FAD-dependent oxidoreductase [Streptosporangiales bacterium]|nr:FAD-dependent oxidoreductase [Streptosporangiales bacterium]
MTTHTSSLSAARRERDLEQLAHGRPLDLLVVGGGITGVGVALDAASRGLSVALVEAHDLAFGTSRWSSKLVHGGLRYLANGHLGIAHESAVERGHLMGKVAPHLVRPLPQLLPEYGTRLKDHLKYIGVGGVADALRVAAGTSRDTLPKPRVLGRVETGRLAPALRRGFDGGLLMWDGQLVDDARLVVTVARTAAAYGARIVTRCRALQLTGAGARLRDERTGAEFDVPARAVVNATGVWAGTLSTDVALRPSRGTHLVVRSSALGTLGAAVSVPFPGQPGRFLITVPWSDGLTLVGLTDVEAGTDIPDVPRPADSEVGDLVAAVNEVLQVPIGTEDVVGTFAGLRPLLTDASAVAANTSDLSRKHAVVTGTDGLVTVTGGKLTTYRRMAEDAVDAAVRSGKLRGGKCRTSWLPLVGAAGASTLDAIDAPRRLVERYGTEATRVVAAAAGDPALLRPLADGVPVIGAELVHAMRHEGALDVDDLLDRRTRVGLVPADRERVLAAARDLLALQPSRAQLAGP